MFSPRGVGTSAVLFTTLLPALGQNLALVGAENSFLFFLFLLPFFFKRINYVNSM